MGKRATAAPRRRTVLLLVIPVVLAASVALVLSLQSTARYRATAEVLIQAAGSDDRSLDTELVVASGSELRSEVRAAVGDEPELSVAAADAADVLQFTASSTNADNAATAANVYADVYVSRSPDAEVVDRAVAPSDPYEPDIVLTALLAALAGLAIGVVAAVFVGWRDSTIRSERQLTKVTGVANLAVVPRHPLGEVRPDDLAVLRDPNSVESEAYRTLRTVLDFVAQDRPFTVLLVTSPRPGEGKSSVAANLAAAMAQAGRKVVLVDGDLRRPQVHRLFVTGNARGLSSILTGESPLQDCVQRIERDSNVALLTAGPPPPDPAELLSHDRLRRALAALAEGSDLVVVDAPPVLPVADPIILAQAADATLLVATAGLSDRREWAETLERLRKVNADVIGSVLLRPGADVQATPSYRYAPSAPPAHWWVTEAARAAARDTNAAAASATDRSSVATLVEPEMPGEGASADAQTDEVASSTDGFSWGRDVGPQELTWKDSDTGTGDVTPGDAPG